MYNAYDVRKNKKNKNKNKLKKKSYKLYKKIAKEVETGQIDGIVANKTGMVVTIPENTVKEKVEVIKPKKPHLNISKEEYAYSIDLMQRIFNVQSVSYDTHAMREFIIGYINEMDYDNISIDIDISGNIYVTKGNADTYPCVVSHIDTVHNIIPDDDYMVLNNGKEFFAIDTRRKAVTGIGGDDKNGIYCCLDNLKTSKAIKLAFFVDEEIGCVGSSKANMDFFADVSFVFQADRQGYSDVTTDIMYTEMFDTDFLVKIIDTLDIYGRTLCDGGMTDVMQLAHNGLKVSMANFSCGYYHPHSDNEYVVIDELILTSILFRDLIKEIYVDGEFHAFNRPDEYDSGYYGGWGQEDTYSYGNMVEQKDSVPNYTEHSKHHEPYDKECSYCGQPTLWDSSLRLPYCNNCLDYDYNN